MKQLLFLLALSAVLFSACKKELPVTAFCDCIVTGGAGAVRDTAIDYYLYLDCGGRKESVKVTARDFKEAKVYQKIKIAGCNSRE